MVFMQSWSRAETVKTILYAISSGPVLRLAQDSTEQNQQFCTARFRPELFHQAPKGTRRAWLSRHFNMVSKGAESVYCVGAKNPLSWIFRKGTNGGQPPSEVGGVPQGGLGLQFGSTPEQADGNLLAGRMIKQELGKVAGVADGLVINGHYDVPASKSGGLGV